jgi:hypothetical protein
MLAAAQSGPPSRPPQPGLVRRPVLESRTPIAGNPRPEGIAVLAAPRPVGAPLLVDAQPLAADAVIASETFEMLPLSFRLTAPITLGPPFTTVFPAGAKFRRLIRDGAVRHCLRREGIYTPAFDEHHEIYPGLCLEDRDGDGRYETAILEPYDPEHAPNREARIAPVGLEPDPAAAASQPQALTLNRRIRVTHLDAGEVQLVAEQGSTASRPAIITSYYGRPEDSLSLSLRDGASGMLGGVNLRLVRDGTGWRIAASGRLAPWLEVRDGGNLIVMGGMEFHRQPSADR